MGAENIKMDIVLCVVIVSSGMALLTEPIVKLCAVLKYIFR